MFPSRVRPRKAAQRQPLPFSATALVFARPAKPRRPPESPRRPGNRPYDGERDHPGAHPPAKANSPVQKLACIFMSVEIFRKRAASAHMQKGGRVEGHLYYPRKRLETRAMRVTLVGA